MSNSSSSMLVFLSILGWSFDIFTVIVNITDVISDGLVCAQFYEAGEYGWFWGVLGTLFIGNVVFTTIFVVGDPGKICERVFKKKIPKWLIFLLVVPIAQAVPVAAWVYNTFAADGMQTNQKPRETEERLYDTASFEQRTGAGAEAMNEASSSLQMVGRLRGAIKQHLFTHAYFYTETAVESIPQVILQLLAVTFLQQVSIVQVVSMASSLLSIVSKGYIFAASATVPTIFWKFFSCAADLFCTFYIFSTVFLRGEDVEGLSGMVPLTDTISMPLITLVWLGKIGFNIALGIAMLLVVAATAYRDVGRAILDVDRQSMMMGIGLFLLGVIVAGPALILFESAKFIFLTLYVSKQEKISATSTLLHSFLYGKGVTQKEFLARVKFLTSLFMEGFQVPFGRKQFTHTNYELSRPKLWTVTNKGYKEALMKADHPGYLDHLATTAISVEDIDGTGRVHQNDFQLTEDDGEAFTLCGLLRECTCSKDTIRFGAAGVWIVFFTLGQLYSLLFPFVAYGLYFTAQNLLQHVCFGCYAVCVVVMVALSPHVVRYTMFFGKFGAYIDHFNSGGSRTMFAAIEQYFTPPVGALLRQVVPSQALPAELCNVVGRFMVAKDLQLSAVKQRDFKRVLNDEEAL